MQTWIKSPTPLVLPSQTKGLVVLICISIQALIIALFRAVGIRNRASSRMRWRRHEYAGVYHVIASLPETN